MTDTPGPILPDEEVTKTDRSGRLFAAIIGLVVVLAALAVLMLIPALRHAPAPVPSVVGETTTTASATLRGAGFSLGATEVTANAKISNDAIVSQQPAAGAKAPRGSAVAVVVNIQPYQLPMPSVVGLTRDAADAQLRTYPFTPVFLEQFSDSVPVGHTVSQAPAAGQPWTTGHPAVVEVSLGPSTNGVHVPDVTGLRTSEMQAALDSAGLSAKLFTVANTGVSAGTVISQLPAPGTLVRAGSPVAVFAAGATQ